MFLTFLPLKSDIQHIISHYRSDPAYIHIVVLFVKERLDLYCPHAVIRAWLYIMVGYEQVAIALWPLIEKELQCHTKDWIIRDHASTLHDIGQALSKNQKTVPAAIKVFEKIEQIERKNGNTRPFNYIGNYTELADCYSKVGDNRKAIQNLRHAEKLHKEMVGPMKSILLANILTNKSVILLRQKEKLWVALGCMLLVRHTLQKYVKGMPISMMAWFLLKKRALHPHKEDLDTLKRHLPELLKDTQSRVFGTLAGTYHNMANVYQDLGKFEKALHYLNLSVHFFKKRKSMDVIDSYYVSTVSLAAVIYYKKGELQLANEYKKCAIYGKKALEMRHEQV